MTRSAGRSSRSRLIPLIVSAITAARPAYAQTDSTGGAAESAPETLRCEITAARRLYVPNRPVWVRLTLHNASDELVEIPLQTAVAAASAIALPPEVVFGTAAEPALHVAYRDEKPVPVSPPAETADAPKGVLRLAPHGSLGTEIDLREAFPALRYEGLYRVEWRPVGGRAGSSSVELRLEPRKEVILVTDKYKLTFILMYDEAPRNVENFLDLVRSGFYDGKTIHKIVPGFLIQGGDPKGDGTGVRPDGKLIPAEFHNAPFQVGTLAMARKPSDPNSASCQFFITLARVPELDGQYTVIGQASNDENLRTLNQIAAEPTDARGRPRTPLVIRSIKDWSEPAGATRLELRPRRSVQRTPATSAHESQPDNP